MVRTQIQLTEEQDRRLQELAGARRVSKAELVRQAVDLLLQRAPLIPDPSERRRKMLEIAGRFHSGRHDISERHDDYLAESYGG